METTYRNTKTIDFNYRKDYVLENKYVKLIPLNIKHLEDLILIANEPAIWKYSF